MSDLEITGLTLSYGATRVLTGLDLTIASGTVVAVLGPSGCGKTTLLRLIAGFERPDAGTLTIDGSVVAGTTTDGTTTWVPPERRRIGIVPQEGALFPHLDVGENIGFGLSRGPNRVARIAECLELVGLAGFERRRPDELSGGQQQRVALARALAPDPAIILLDEPFSALDSGLRSELRDDVREVLRSAGATALIVTHDQHEAFAMADQVAVLANGIVAQLADPIELYRHPISLEVARFVGDAIEVSCTMQGGLAVGELGELAVGHTDLADHTRVTAVVRPEQLEIDGGAGVPATVQATTFLGSEARVRLALVSERTVEARFLGTDVPPIGATVAIRVRGPVPAFAEQVHARTVTPGATD